MLSPPTPAASEPSRLTKSSPRVAMTHNGDVTDQRLFGWGQAGHWFGVASHVVPLVLQKRFGAEWSQPQLDTPGYASGTHRAQKWSGHPVMKSPNGQAKTQFVDVVTVNIRVLIGVKN